MREMRESGFGPACPLIGGAFMKSGMGMMDDNVMN